MPANIKKKESFGSVTVDHVSPAYDESAPTAINVHISFEEALKLHLGLGQALAQLNSYNRSTRAGRRSAVNLCIYTAKGRITVNEGWVREGTNKAEDQMVDE